MSYIDHYEVFINMFHK